MNSYIDITTNEEFDEDISLREALDKIDMMLLSMSKEERISYFATFSKPKDTDFVKEIGGIYYVVRTHFSERNGENLKQKIDRLLGIDD